MTMAVIKDWVRKQTNLRRLVSPIECFRSCDQQPYLHTKTKGRTFIRMEFNSQKSISLLQNGRCFFVSLHQHGRRVTSCEILYTPYSKMAAIFVFFSFHANRALGPRSKLNVLLHFTFENEAIGANLHGKKIILTWRPFWNKVYAQLNCVETRSNEMRS